MVLVTCVCNPVVILRAALSAVRGCVRNDMRMIHDSQILFVKFYLKHLEGVIITKVNIINAIKRIH